MTPPEAFAPEAFAPEAFAPEAFAYVQKLQNAWADLAFAQELIAEARANCHFGALCRVTLGRLSVAPTLLARQIALN